MTIGWLLEWRDARKQEAIEDGAETFMGLPDKWFEDAHWICPSGHVRGMFLGTDRGGKCMVCRLPVILGPPMVTEEELAAVAQRQEAPALNPGQ